MENTHIISFHTTLMQNNYYSHTATFPSITTGNDLTLNEVTQVHIQPFLNWIREEHTKEQCKRMKNCDSVYDYDL